MNEEIKMLADKCNKGDGESCYTLGDMYDDDEGIDVEQDLDKAVDYYKMACDLGHAESCHILGGKYYFGKDVTRDICRALEYFQKACDLGFGKGCSILGDVDKHFRGDRQNNTKALEYFTKGCDLGDQEGCKSYAELKAEIDENNEHNMGTKEKMLANKCAKGHSESCYALGVMNNDGRDVEKNESKAIEFYKKACDLGDERGCDDYNKLKK